MDSSYHQHQGAQFNDAFVILKQAVMDEPPEILNELQGSYGGKIRFPFHVTCQKFPSSQEQLFEVVTKLEPYLSTIKPFTLSIDCVESLYSEFFECEVLKARAHPTDYLSEITQGINDILDEAGLNPLYKSPSIWLTVLEGIKEPVPETKLKDANVFRNIFLNVDFAIIDQLKADKTFNRVREINLVEY